MDNLPNWVVLFKKWKEEGTNGGIKVYSNRDKINDLLSEINEWCDGKTMRQILQQKGLVAALSCASALPEVVTMSGAKMIEIIKKIMKAPSHIKESADTHELRGSMWASNILFLLIPSLPLSDGTQLASSVGVEGNKLEKGFVDQLANSLSNRLSAPISSSSSSLSSSFSSSFSSSSFSSSSSSSEIVSSSLGFPNVSPSPFPLRELSRLCLLLLHHPSVFPVLDSLICLQPGLTPEYQLDPAFVAHVIKDKEIFSQLSIAAKSALWIHSSDTFSLMVTSLVTIVAERPFMTDSQLEASLQTSFSLLSLFSHHPSLYSEFMGRIEAAFMRSRDVCVLRIARALNACVLRSPAQSMRTVRDFWEPKFGTFVSILGRTRMQRVDEERIEEEARKMNEERVYVIAERRGVDASRLWMVMVTFVDWACDALLCLLLSSSREFPAIAEYVAWLVHPEVRIQEEEDGDLIEDTNVTDGEGFKKISQILLSKSGSKRIDKEKEKDKEKDKEEERDAKKRKKDTNQDLLDIICELPIPREMALKVLEKYFNDKEITQQQAQFLLQFALFGNKAKDKNIMKDETSPQAQKMGLDILKTIKFSNSNNIVFQWLEKIEKAWGKTSNESDVMERIKEIRLKKQNVII